MIVLVIIVFGLAAYAAYLRADRDLWKCEAITMRRQWLDAEDRALRGEFALRRHEHSYLDIALDDVQSHPRWN